MVNIKLADGANAPVIIIGSPDTKWDPVKKDFFTPKKVRGVTVRNLSVDGNKQNQDQSPAGECWKGPQLKGCQGEGPAAIRNNGITIRGAEDIKVSEVVLNNTRSGGLVTEKHCKRLKIERMRAQNNFFDGFAGYQTSDSLLLNCDLSENDGAGASLDIDFSGNKFDGVSLSRNKHQGVFARSLKDLKIVNSEIVDNGYQGIFLAQSESGPCANDVQIRNSVISGSGKEKKEWGQGLRLNDAGCTGTCTENVRFEKNTGGNVSVQAMGGTLRIT